VIEKTSNFKLQTSEKHQIPNFKAGYPKRDPRLRGTAQSKMLFHNQRRRDGKNFENKNWSERKIVS